MPTKTRINLGEPLELTAASPTAVPGISIIIPAHNELHNIEPLVVEIMEALDGQETYEIIYIDDGSTDNTLDELRRVRRAVLAPLRIISHATCLGQSHALLSAARVANGQLLVTLDADGQNVPADIPTLLMAAKKHEQDSHFCIAGWRRERQDTAWKRLQSRIANNVRRFILHDATPDTGCGLKVMPRQTMLAVPAFNHVHRFLPALVQQIGGTVEVVEVKHRPRMRDSSKYGMWDRLIPGVFDLAGVLWLSRRLSPISATEIFEQ